MNIVKLKNITLDTSSGLTEEQCELFNTKYKGKYVHAINWTYCVPLEDITNDEVVRLSQELCIKSKKDTDLQSLNRVMSTFALSAEQSNSRWMICTPTSRPKDFSKYEFLITYNNTNSGLGPVLGCLAGEIKDNYLIKVEGKAKFDSENLTNGYKSIYLTEVPSDSLLVKIIPDAENKYLIYKEELDEEGNLIKYYLRNNSGSLSWQEDTSSNTETLWSLTFKEGGEVEMICSSTTNNTLKYNSGSPRFRCYSYSNTNNMYFPSLYMREIPVIKENPTLYFDTDTVSIYTDDVSTENPLYNPNGVEGVYSSSDESVATVDPDGIVTPIGKGECTITFTSKENDLYNSISVFYNLIVKPALLDSEYAFSNGYYIECEVGDVIDNPAYTPNDDVNFSSTYYYSDDIDVVQVSQEGVFTIVGEGEATVHFVGEDSELYKDTDITCIISSTFNPIKGYDWLYYDLLLPYIDIEETEDVNDVTKYLLYNKIERDDDITIEELKRFRTWLAELLYSVSAMMDDKTKHMLGYYISEMEDDTCKLLQMFGSVDIQFATQSSSCGCGSVNSYLSNGVQVMNSIPIKHTCGCNDLSSLYQLGSINTCDPLSIYRKNIYAHMVSTFSNIEFWLQFDKILIEEVKRYIDGIIRNNFVLVTSEYVSNYVDCSCLNEKDVKQKNNINILNNLSKSLEYILNDDVNGHKNFISDSLSLWSSSLYEKMRW